MLILLEGPDGSGKTTLAKQLAKQTGYKQVCFSYPKSEQEKAEMLSMYEKVIKSAGNVIIDRCWYSEMVYGPILRKENNISFPQMYTLERLLAKKGAMIIYCTGDRNTLWERCLKRGEDYVTDLEDFINICRGYNTLMLDVPHYIPVTKYEYIDV